MRPEGPALRPAIPDDAEHLARLVHMASEGLATHFWAGLAGPGETPHAVGVRRVARDEGAFSWRNATVAEVGGEVAGALVSYRIGPEPETLEDTPAIFRPLQALENRALGTHYVNVLATYPRFRRRGVASRLLAEAERQAEGSRGLSLIVADANGAARRLYGAFGFAEAAREPIVADGWRSSSSAWLLMLKPPKALG